ncbi:MAG: ABC transporter permease [Steroidobacteraceae bacterium]
MSLASQISALTASSLRHIPRRLGSSLVIVIGIAGVVTVLIPVLAMYVGFRATITSDGRADRAIVLTRDATTEYVSGLSRDAVGVVSNAPGVRRDARGRPLLSAEVVLAAPVSRRRDHSDVDITLRGVGPQYFAIRPELKLVDGRTFRPGTQELLVGAAARSQFEGLEIGDRVRLQGGDWTVVGVFAGGSGARTSELLADAHTVMSAYKLESYNSVTVALDSAAALSEFKAALARDARLFVTVRSEPQFLASESSDESRLLGLVAYVIGSIMALGAVFAALNSMYSAVTTRGTEIATLRAIGFRGRAVAVAVVAEALCLALVGAAVGVCLAFAAFDGVTISTVGGALFDSQLVYSLAVTPPLVVTAIIVACGVGLAGGLLPAIRAARANIADTLYER